MKLVDQYIAKTILGSIGLVTLMLAGLQIFILFVNQLGDLGHVHFGIFQAAWYVLLLLPYQIYLFFPMAALLGCLIGLGMMANHRELVVMRAAGMSIWQVTLSVFKAAILLILMVTLLGETIVPQLSRVANDVKTEAMTEGQTLRTSKGMWLRYHNDFITIGRVVSNMELHNVYQFRFDAKHDLIFSRHMKEIYYTGGNWRAIDIAETMIHETNTETRQKASMDWDVPLRPKVFGVGTNESDEMTLHELRQYLRAQKLTNRAALNYWLDFWQRIFQPLTTLVMMMLAIPFIFGPLRSSTMGSKLLVGATVGFGFHILNKFFGPLCQVLQWPPILAAVGPTFLFALVGIYLMQRT